MLPCSARLRERVKRTFFSFLTDAWTFFHNDFLQILIFLKLFFLYKQIFFTKWSIWGFSCFKKIYIYMLINLRKIVGLRYRWNTQSILSILRLIRKQCRERTILHKNGWKDTNTNSCFVISTESLQIKSEIVKHLRKNNFIFLRMYMTMIAIMQR